MCSSSEVQGKGSEGGSSMEDQDRETRIDEDVEGHSHYSPNKGAPNKGRNVGKDEEGDDVEAHSHYSPNKGAPNKGRNVGKDEEGDDVEAHVHLNAPNKGAPNKG